MSKTKHLIHFLNISLHSLIYICEFIQLTDTNGLMKFIVLFQQLSMHHIYNDIFHQAAVSQSLSNIRINIMSFISHFIYKGTQETLLQWDSADSGGVMI